MFVGGNRKIHQEYRKQSQKNNSDSASEEQVQWQRILMSKVQVFIGKNNEQEIEALLWILAMYVTMFDKLMTTDSHV